MKYKIFYNGKLRMFIGSISISIIILFTIFVNIKNIKAYLMAEASESNYFTLKQPEVTKYAVQIYGINQDEDENGNILGLTFGPATGDNYNNAYITHEYEEITENPGNYYVKIIKHIVASNGSETTSSSYLTDSSSNNVIRTTAEKEKYDVNMHEMTWAEIKEVSDKTAFTDCMLCGDTKSVKIYLNDEIKSGNVYEQYGDGAGSLYNTINDYYLSWNPKKQENSAIGVNIILDNNEINSGSNARNVGAYRISHMRATLIGEELSNPNIEYAGDINLTENTCIYSCIEEELQKIITEKKIKYVTGTYHTTGNYSLNEDIADKIWLFSLRELYGTGQISGNNLEGIGSYGVGYEKFSNVESKYYISTYSDKSNVNRRCYPEYSPYGAYLSWGSRSVLLYDTYSVGYVFSTGQTDGSWSASAEFGISFGFCIQ